MEDDFIEKLKETSEIPYVQYQVTEADMEVEPQKILIVGDADVGKTTLIKAFYNMNSPAHSGVIAPEHHLRMDVDGRKVAVKIVDVPSKVVDADMRRVCYADVNVVMLCFSFDLVDSLRSIRDKWFPEMVGVVPSKRMVIVGLKSDLKCIPQGYVAEGFLSTDEAVLLQDELRITRYAECSATDRGGVMELFQVAFPIVAELIRPFDPRKYPLRILALGKPGCGKTTMIRGFVNSWAPFHTVTCLATVYLTEIRIGPGVASMAIWDVPRETDYGDWRNFLNRPVDVVLLCFSIDDPHSLSVVREKWLTDVGTCVDPGSVILVGLKPELREDDATLAGLVERDLRPVFSSDGEDVVKELRFARYVEVSGRTRRGLMELFLSTIPRVAGFYKATEMYIKVIVVGPIGCGKTSLIRAFFDNENAFGIPELSVVKAYPGEVIRHGKVIPINIWDVPGGPDPHNFRKCCYQLVNAALVCFAIDDPMRFRNVGVWVNEVKPHIQTEHMILVGLKKDTRNDAATVARLKEKGLHPVTREEGEAKAKELGVAKYAECSWRTREGVYEIFASGVTSVSNLPKLLG